MNAIVDYLGLDVHKESIAVSIAPPNSTARIWTAVASRTRHRFGEDVQVFGDVTSHESARGLAQSKTLREVRKRQAGAPAFGVRWL